VRETASQTFTPRCRRQPTCGDFRPGQAGLEIPHCHVKGFRMSANRIAAVRAGNNTSGSEVSPKSDIDGDRGDTCPDQVAIRALENVLYRSPFVVIDPQGSKVATAPSAAEARRLCKRLPTAATIVGTLVDGVWGVDIDPTDRQADPVLGDLVAELLVRWAHAWAARWYLRESGRPGGRHILLQVGDDALTDLLKLTTELAAEYSVDVTVRKPMRMLSAPHRLGLPAPTLGGSLTADDLPARHRSSNPRLHSHIRSTSHRAKRTGCPEQPDSTPSAAEYGNAFYLARSGFTASQAWESAGSCQVSSRGRASWLWYIWLKVVTIVAAEDGLDETDAWARAQEACPQRAQTLGRAGWRHALCVTPPQCDALIHHALECWASTAP
jgi:hypothetical protein